MADDRIKRARKLLGNPNLTSEDRERLLSAFPTLKPQKGEVELDVMPAEDITPMQSVPDQVPTRIAPADVPSLAPAVQEETDVGYSALIQAQQESEVDAADYRLEDDSIRNMSKRASLYVDADPIVNADKDTPLSNTYLHMEPTLQEVREWAANVGDKSAFTDLEENGKESKVYKEYADIQWRKVRKEFANTGEPAVRVSQLDPDSAMDWYNKLSGGFTSNVMIPFLGGYDDAVTAGLGKQVLATSYQGFTPEAEKKLVETGVLQPYEKRFVETQYESPVISMMGSAAGMLNPFSLSRKAAALGLKAMKGATGLVSKAVVPFTEAMGSSAAEELIRSGGQRLRGEKTKSPEEAQRTIGLATGLGGSLGVAAELLGKAGAARTTALRKNPVYEEILTRVEQGIPGEAGGTTMIPGSGGMRPHKMWRERAKEIAAEKAEARRMRQQAPEPRYVGEELASEVEPHMRKELVSYKNEALKGINASKEAYYRSTEHIKKSVAPLGESIESMIHESQLYDRDLPFSEGLNNKLRDIVKQLQGWELDKGKLDKLMYGKTVPAALAGEPFPEAILSAVTEKGRKWGEFNSRQFDKIISGLDKELDIEAAKYGSKTIPAELKRIMKEIRDIRDTFPANEYAPKSMREVVSIGGEDVVIEGGLSALNARARNILNKVRNAENSMGLKNVLDEPDILSQKNAIVSRAKEWGMANRTNDDKALREIFKGRPDIIRYLDAIGSGETYSRYMGKLPQGGITGRSVGAEPALWATLNVARIWGPYSDPMFMAMSRLKGKGTAAAALASAKGQEIETSSPAERQLAKSLHAGKEEQDDITLLWKLYTESRERGIWDTIKKENKIER